MRRSHHATTGNLDGDELRTLRRSAAMAHTTGAISFRLSAGGVTIVDVVPTDQGAPVDQWRAEPSPGTRIDPCGFRIAVARAWDDYRAGRQVGLVGLPSKDVGEPLTVTWTVGAPGKLIGLGAVRARCASRMVWAFASILAPATLTAVLAEVVVADDGPAAPVGDRLTGKLVHDDLLDTTVVHVEANAVDPPPSSIVRVLDEVLRRMLAAVGAAEVVEALSAPQL